MAGTTRTTQSSTSAADALIAWWPALGVVRSIGTSRSMEDGRFGQEGARDGMAEFFIGYLSVVPYY